MRSELDYRGQSRSGRSGTVVEMWQIAVCEFAFPVNATTNSVRRLWLRQLGICGRNYVRSVALQM